MPLTNSYLITILVHMLWHSGELHILAPLALLFRLGRSSRKVFVEFPAQMASNAENVSIWWRHHDKLMCLLRIKCLSMIIPSTFTQSWSCEVIQVLLSNTKSVGAIDEDDSIINWNLYRLAFMPLLVNHSMPWWQSDYGLNNTSDNMGLNMKQYCHPRSCKGCIYH